MKNKARILVILIFISAMPYKDVRLKKEPERFEYPIVPLVPIPFFI